MYLYRCFDSSDDDSFELPLHEVHHQSHVCISMFWFQWRWSFWTASTWSTSPESCIYIYVLILVTMIVLNCLYMKYITRVMYLYRCFDSSDDDSFELPLHEVHHQSHVCISMFWFQWRWSFWTASTWSTSPESCIYIDVLILVTMIVLNCLYMKYITRVMYLYRCFDSSDDDRFELPLHEVHHHGHVCISMFWFQWRWSFWTASTWSTSPESCIYIDVLILVTMIVLNCLYMKYITRVMYLYRCFDSSDDDRFELPLHEVHHQSHVFISMFWFQWRWSFWTASTWSTSPESCIYIDVLIPVTMIVLNCLYMKYITRVMYLYRCFDSSDDDRFELPLHEVHHQSHVFISMFWFQWRWSFWTASTWSTSPGSCTYIDVLIPVTMIVLNCLYMKYITRVMYLYRCFDSSDDDRFELPLHEVHHQGHVFISMFWFQWRWSFWTASTWSTSPGSCIYIDVLIPVTMIVWTASTWSTSPGSCMHIDVLIPVTMIVLNCLYMKYVTRVMYLYRCFDSSDDDRFELPLHEVHHQGHVFISMFWFQWRWSFWTASTWSTSPGSCIYIDVLIPVTMIVLNCLYMKYVTRVMYLYRCFDSSDDDRFELPLHEVRHQGAIAAQCWEGHGYDHHRRCVSHCHRIKYGRL